MKYRIIIYDPNARSLGDYNMRTYPVEVMVERMELVTSTLARVATKAEAEALIAGLEARDGEPAEIVYRDTTKPTEAEKHDVRKWWLP
jgi:hypothetical protein